MAQTVDISTLGIKVDATSATAAGKDLDKFEAAAKKAEKAGDNLVKATDKITPAMSKASSQSKASERAANDFTQALERQSATLGKSRSEIARYEASLQNLSATQREQVNNAIKAMESHERAQSTMGGLTSQMGRLATAATALLAGGALLKYFGSVADAATLAEARIKLVTSSSAETKKVTGELFNIAQALQLPFQEVVNSYPRMARAIKEVGGSTSEALAITRIFAQTVKVSGANTQEAAASALQFAQALSSGVLQGDELRSILENNSRLASALAEGLGVTVGQLRKLGAEGQLTTDKIVRALLSQKDKLEKEGSEIPRTIAGGWAQLTNEMERTIATSTLVMNSQNVVATAMSKTADSLKRAREEQEKYNQAAANVPDSVRQKGTMAVGAYIRGQVEKPAGFEDGTDARDLRVAAADQLEKSAAAAQRSFQNMTKEIGGATSVVAEYDGKIRKLAEAYARLAETGRATAADEKQFLEAHGALMKDRADALTKDSKGTIAQEKAQQLLNAQFEKAQNILEEARGRSGAYEENVAALTASFKAGKIAAWEWGQGMGHLYYTQTEAGKATVELSKQVDKLNKDSLKKFEEETEKTTEALEKQAKQMEDENIKLVQGEAALYNMAIAQKQLEINTAYAEVGASAYTKELEKQLAALKRLSAAATEKAGIKDVAEYSKQAERDWKKTMETIDRTAEDLFVNFFTNGAKSFKDLARVLKDTILRELYKMVMQKWVFNIAANVTGGPGTGGGGISGVPGGTGANSPLMQGIGMGVNYFTGASTASAFAASSYGSAAMAGGGGAAELASVGAAAAEGAAGSIMSTVAAAMPYIAAILAIVAIAKSFEKPGGAKDGGSFFQAFNASGTGADGRVPGSDNGRFFTPSGGDASLRELGTGTAKGYYDTIKALGGQAGAFSFGLGYDSDPRGTSDNRISSALLNASGQQIFGSKDRGIGRDNANIGTELQLEAQRMILAALQSSELPKDIADILNSITASTATVEQINAVITAATEMRAILDALKNLDVKGVTPTSLKAMQLAGENLGQTFQRVIGGYVAMVDAYTTEEQKLVNANADVVKTFKDLGIAVPKNNAEFLELLKTVDFSTESGRKLYEALRRVEPAFAATARAADAAAAATKQAGEAFDNAAARIFGASYTTQQNIATQQRNLATLQQAGILTGHTVETITAALRSLDANGIAALRTSVMGLPAPLREAALSFLGLVDPLNGVAEAANAAAAASAAYEEHEARIEAVKAARAAARGGLSTFLQGLLINQGTSPLSNEERLARSQEMLEKMVKRAEGGDTNAIGQVGSSFQSFLELTRSIYGTGGPFNTLFTEYFQRLEKVSGVNLKSGFSNQPDVVEAANDVPVTSKRTAVAAEATVVELRNLSKEVKTGLSNLQAEVAKQARQADLNTRKTRG